MGKEGDPIDHSLHVEGKPAKSDKIVRVSEHTWNVIEQHARRSGRTAGEWLTHTIQDRLRVEDFSWAQKERERAQRSRSRRTHLDRPNHLRVIE